MFENVEIIDDSNEKHRTRRMVFVGKTGPGVAKVVAVASFAKTIDTDGEEVKDVKSA